MTPATVRPAARPAGRRHRARELALRVLFEIEDTAKDPEEALRYQAEDMSVAGDVLGYARQLVLGSVANLGAVDAAIAASSSHWRLDDLGKVERAVLRIAVYELLFEPGTPVPVSIDEAVELARAYSGEEARSYVNGVLGKVAESVDGPR